MLRRENKQCFHLERKRKGTCFMDKKLMCTLIDRNVLSLMENHSNVWQRMARGWHNINLKEFLLQKITSREDGIHLDSLRSERAF